MADFMEKYRNANIDETNLSKELSEHPANYIFVGEKAVQMAAQYDVAKIDHETLIAKLDEEIRANALADGKKITEALIGKEIERDPRYVDSAKALAVKRASRDTLRVMDRGWQGRLEMLKALAFKQQAELRTIDGSSIRNAA